MITNTCLTGGSFDEPAEGEPAEPPEPVLALGAAGVLAVDGDLADATGELLVADGEGSGSAAGGSVALADEGLSAPGAGVEPGADAGARITFTGRWVDAAMVSAARERDQRRHVVRTTADRSLDKRDR